MCKKIWRITKKFGDDLLVRNDISMCEERFYIITGVNNGSKTTFARGVGICQLLAQIGMYVPAETAEMSVTDYKFTHFPKEEEVGIDSSRFTTEINQLKEICGLITPLQHGDNERIYPKHNAERVP